MTNTNDTNIDKVMKVSSMKITDDKLMDTNGKRSDVLGESRRRKIFFAVNEIFTF